MTINLQTGGFIPPQALPGARSADVQIEIKRPTPTSGSAAPDIVKSAETKSSGEAKFDQIALAASTVFEEIYPVNDKSFTIFKDSSGQYITRYTSLRDGRVTYIPEPQMLRMFESKQAALRTAARMKA